ncbi:MAG: PQQ-dependent sugar dehydrogenase [Nevskia sp.]|nr:PQQ-dependent sugar dehydrogenase [Nevskia sp.]
MLVQAVRRRLCLSAFCLVLAGATQAAPPAPLYRTVGDCDGFPRTDLKAAPGLCVGLVAEHLGFARGVVALGDRVYVADMGGWHKNRGRILRLDQGGHGKPQVVLSGLNQPNSLAPAPDGGLYIGLSGRIVRFDPRAPDPAQTLRDVLTGLPDSGRHPLAALAVAPDGSLFVNVGSATDHCEQANGAPPDPSLPCPDASGAPPRGSILHFTPGSTAIDAATLKPYATGLRNSMGLAVLPSGQLLAATNARDFINHADPSLSDEELPHEPLNRVEQGADYGWPYCFDDRRPSPEYPKYDCGAKHPPTLLLPAHAAPLGLLLYRGRALPGLEGRLVIPYHGYRASGHRIVSLALDGRSRPGPPEPLVSGWDFAEGRHPQGAPVALWEMDDGSLLISEDHNGSLLRLAFSASP